MDDLNVSFLYQQCVEVNQITSKFLGFPRCPLPRIPNGAVNHGNREPGDVATYSCRQGYRLKGPEKRECGKDGKWSGEDPVCESKK